MNNNILNEKQQKINQYLLEQDSSGLLSQMYMGAILVINQNTNPDRLNQSANSIRELIEKLHRIFDLPVNTQRIRLTDRVKNLKVEFDKIQPGISMLNDDGMIPSNPVKIITSEIVNYLEKSSEFFEQHELYDPSRIEQSRRVVNLFSPGKIPLPKNVEEMKAKDLSRLRQYFESVAHHSSTTEKIFMEKLRTFENILIDLLKPVPVEMLSEIDRIIKEGESNDKR